MAEPVLAVDDLSVEYRSPAGAVKALEGVSFELGPGQVVGIVGETGCGKSTLASAIPRLLPEPPARVRSGRITFLGEDLLSVPKWQMPNFRGTRIGMVLQEPLNSLNPAFRVFDQMAEALRIRHAREQGVDLTPRLSQGRYDYSRPERPSTGEALAHSVVPDLPSPPPRVPPPRAGAPNLRQEALEYLTLVRINDPAHVLGLYPHELSGGMRQRVMIAMALSMRPALLIADEPTSALDVTIQAQVLTLMKELLEEVRTSILFISHDLGVIAEIADSVGVMYAGHLVEYGSVHDVFERPQHPYTKGLMRAIPSGYKSDGPLRSLAGSVPSLVHPPPGCTFHPRCPIARAACAVPPSPTAVAVPAGRGVEADHRSACLFPLEVAGIP